MTGFDLAQPDTGLFLSIRSGTMSRHKTRKGTACRAPTRSIPYFNNIIFFVLVKLLPFPVGCASMR